MKLTVRHATGKQLFHTQCLSLCPLLILFGTTHTRACNLRSPIVRTHHFQPFQPFSLSACGIPRTSKILMTSSGDNAASSASQVSLTPAMPRYLTLAEFINTRSQQLTHQQHFVIGNKAGDADSIISAISLAYVESLIWMQSRDASKSENTDAWKTSLLTPIVSIPKLDLATQRPETALLLQLAGISSELQDRLVFVDDDRLSVPTATPSAASGSMNGASVTLVDHNRLDNDFHPLEWKVRTIRDHHLDERYYTDTCLVRQVAFEEGHALVASTCTLVVERMQEDQNGVFPPNKTNYPADLSLLLLGVILLDSVNLNPAAGKVTPRDVVAVEHLLTTSSWQDLSSETKDRVGMTMNSIEEGAKPNTALLFDALQSAKFDPHFWQGLAVRDALRLDYKSFEASPSAPSLTTAPSVFGISSVLLPLHDFVQNHADDWQRSILQFMEEKSVDFFVILFSSSSPAKLLERQMMICGRDPSVVSSAVAFLRQRDLLQLHEIGDITPSRNGSVTVRPFDQRNAKASRKQVAPLFLAFFENNESLSL